uniref:Uncharacterized protein n=1 Tax=Loa loa TaxID=7209 RepID=A0A1I7VRZ5_LOALO
MAVSVEKSPAQSFQLHAIPAVVRFIGYRKKRNNAYGDEAISPTTDLTLSKPAPAEQAPTQVGQSYAAVIPDSVESSGYRKKRNNAYGDEAISPTTDLTLSKPAPAEQAPTQVGQSYAAVIPDSVESSGYRKKRNNAYGDEAISPTTDLTLSKPAPAEQAPTQVGQSYAAVIPDSVESSGYRKKRNNAYGDEAISPTTDLTLSKPAPAEQAPTQVGQSYAAVIPDSVESSGYRKKRNNAYGDEAISPTTDLTLSQHLRNKLQHNKLVNRMLLL